MEIFAAIVSMIEQQLNVTVEWHEFTTEISGLEIHFGSIGDTIFGIGNGKQDGDAYFIILPHSLTNKEFLRSEASPIMNPQLRAMIAEFNGKPFPTIDLLDPDCPEKIIKSLSDIINEPTPSRNSRMRGLKQRIDKFLGLP